MNSSASDVSNAGPAWRNQLFRLYLVQRMAVWLPLANFLNSQAFARFASYDLSVIPLFILMGHFATQGGISKALFQFAAGAMGRFKGGLAMGAVFACAAFGAICGSSVATAQSCTRVKQSIASSMRPAVPLTFCFVLSAYTDSATPVRSLASIERVAYASAAATSL